MEEEQKDHYSAERNHWCIVTYVGTTPMYYAGYFGGLGELKPAITSDFDKALKLHSKIAATAIMDSLYVCSGSKIEFKVEDHKWM